MNSKRRAELQRKLSMGAVPTPPPGLAERIKADIPNYLEAGPARGGFSWQLTMRIAASIILLITSALLTLQLLEPETQPAKAARGGRLTPAIMPIPQQSVAADSASAPRAETVVSLEMAEELPAANATPPPAPVLQAERRRDGESDQSVSRAAGGTASDNAGSRFEHYADLVTAPAAPPPPPPMVAAPAPAPAPVPPPPEAQALREEISVTASAPKVSRSSALVPEARAASLSLEKSSVFGISVDPAVFQSIKTSIEQGERPPARSVDVEALVNYFAGAPARAPRKSVTLEVEASPAPLPAEGERAILRFTVDTAQIDVGENASVPPIATDARIEINVSSTAVESFRRIGDAEPVTAESALLYNTSVTGLYELDLKPKLRASQLVATIRLTYRSVTDGRERTIQRDIRGRDLMKTWGRASRRHRLATLGAVWSETLKGTPGNSEVAKRAAELATQDPTDERARELANAASATTGGGR